jgi:hypothetical protein
MKRQVIQSIGQFIVVVTSGLMIYDMPPENLDQLSKWLWQPALQGIVSVCGIFGVSRIGNKLELSTDIIKKVK